MTARAEQLAAVLLERRAAIGASSHQAFQIERWKGAALFPLTAGVLFFAATQVEVLPSAPRILRSQGVFEGDRGIGSRIAILHDNRRVELEVFL